MSAQKLPPHMHQPSEETNHKTIDPAALAWAGCQLRKLLAWHQQTGIKAYPVAPELQSFLQRSHVVDTRLQHIHRDQAPSQALQKKKASPSPTSPALPSSAQRENKPSRARKKTGMTGAEASVQPSLHPNDSLVKIVTEHKSCELCGASSSVSALVQPGLGQGKTKPLEKIVLLIVGDYPDISGFSPEEQSGLHLGNGHTGGSSVVFGREEDILVEKMIQAMGIARKKAVLTTVMKCFRRKGNEPTAPQRTHCLRFLQREIDLIQPSVICTMGELSSGALLKKTSPIMRLRSRFYPYRTGTGSIIQVMPTLHPRLLLPDNKVLKRMVWEDLQKIMHYLNKEKISLT